MQQWVFEKILQLDEKEVRSFEHLLSALRYGAPPHGGFAFGEFRSTPERKLGTCD